MAKKNDGFLEFLVQSPWWVSVFVSLSFYMFATYIAPNIETENMILSMFLPALSQVATLFAFILLLPAPFAFLNQYKKKQLLESQKNIDSIRALSWRQFEEMVGEAYRRQGFHVIENQTAGADGGIDIQLKKDGFRHLVQCKQYRKSKVGVSIVREMYGVLIAEKAASMTIITSGYFTQDAQKFAYDKPIDLINGKQLERMVKNLQVRQSSHQVSVSIKDETPDYQCPHCNSKLVLRTTKKGTNIGKQFYGCASFPKCRYIRQLSE